MLVVRSFCLFAESIAEILSKVTCAERQRVHCESRGCLLATAAFVLLRPAQPEQLSVRPLLLLLFAVVCWISQPAIPIRGQASLHFGRVAARVLPIRQSPMRSSDTRAWKSEWEMQLCINYTFVRRS
eukprot:3583040-Pleurochrysis_carterae.AAC.3